ncbi:MAG: hypothetical protein U9O98_10525, partial [Asgard group archaeon]|nr:hypothetical protein [Asgard group archaeon]
MSKNVFIFDSSPLVYIYLNKPRGYEPHPLLLKYKRELGMEFLLAKNDLDKDLVNPLQTKYGNQIGILFSLKMSPRDELFEDLKENALKNHYITKEDVYNHKLTDIDIVRLAIKYQQEDKEVTIISDDEGVHNLVSDIEVEYELKIIYTHLFFLELLPLLTDKNDKEIIKENIQESYYYLKNYLKKDERYLPYEKVMSESIFLLSQVTLASESDEETQLQKDIEQYIKQGTTSKKITKFIPLLKVMRNKRIDSNYPTEEACLDLLSELRT